MSFGPQVHRWPKHEISKRVDELAGQLGIVDILDRKPAGLSGGERQRVSLGRALAIRPAVLCLDEPLSALDEETHAGMIRLISGIVKENGITALHITHNINEANQMADCLFQLEGGKLTQTAASALRGDGYPGWLK